MSSINPNNIDGTYPIAGQDNDSQGFRDNFTNIKNNLGFAELELNDLQTYALLKAPLGSVAQTTVNNDLNYTQLIHPQLIGTVEAFSNIGVPSTSTPTINWASGNYQSITLSQATTIQAISNWPTASLNVYAKLRLQVIVPNTSYTLTFPSAVSLNISDIQGAVGQTINFPTTGVYLFELGSSDGGVTITIADLVNNYQTMAGNISISGTFTTSGARVEAGYQYNNVATTGSSVTVNQNVNQVIFDPASTFNSLYITLPAGNVDAQTINISSTKLISNIVVYGNPGTAVTPNANITLAAGTAMKFFFHASESEWYKIG